MIIQISQNQNKIKMNRLLKMKKVNKLLKKRMKLITKINKFLSKGIFIQRRKKKNNIKKQVCWTRQ